MLVASLVLTLRENILVVSPLVILIELPVAVVHVLRDYVVL